MPILTIYSAAYCQEQEVAGAVAKALSLKVLEDRQIIAEAASTYGLSENKFYRALFGKPSVFNTFTRERERCVSCYKAVVARRLLEDDLLLLGLAGSLVPKTMTHVLKVCLAADEAFRLQTAARSHHLDPKALTKLIAQEDEARTRWTDFLAQKDPGRSSPCDILIPMDATPVQDAADLIQDRAQRAVTLPTQESSQAAMDFALAARVEAALAVKGHVLRTDVKLGRIELHVDKNVVRPERLEEELRAIVRDEAGDAPLEVRLGPDIYRTDVYRPFDFENPAKVLVVDDERDFAVTLSERLKMREMGAAVVTSGEQALRVVEEDEPEVILLDLKMPEIHGMDVLRMIRQGHPRVPVIILSGTGNEKDFQTCLNQGAFACLQKPVDFKELTETIRRAYATLDTERKKG
ncbi:response regulator [Desulfonatronum thiodismutans]|uniref:response regulator n=1 Tax=Desulfonatronum thiodismutans TaxID=159290 RepID=UPI0004ABEDDD|nr:response regulator [Desulfonatronum thiodismutans]